MPDVSVVQITVWLGSEQAVEIVANAAIDMAGGALVQPCSDEMDFTRSDVAAGASGADVRALVTELCGKLSSGLQQSAKTIPICTQGAKIVTCGKPATGSARTKPSIAKKLSG